MGNAPPKPAKRGPKPRKPIRRSAPPARSLKRIPKVTQTERGKEEDRLNDLFSRVIRAQYPLCAIRLGRTIRFEVDDTFTGCSVDSTDAAHLFPKGAYPRLRWDLRNAVGACRACHDYMGTHKAEWEAFMRSRLNVQDWDDLMRIHLSGPSPDRAEVRATLTAALNRLKGNR